MSAAVRLDLNEPGFQQALFKLTSQQQIALLAGLRKIAQLSWEQVYRDKGLRWEAIKSREGANNMRLYSIRIDRKFRAVVIRDGEWMRMLTLHPDHDSAYD